MQFLIFIPALLLFLYSLYRLVRDDYVFIRKGISLEQAFDIAFVTLWSCLFTSRLVYFLFHLTKKINVFLDFFSVQIGGLSLTGAIIGGVLAIYFLGKYKRVPLGRLSDFLSLSFLYTLPLLFSADALFMKKNEQLFVFLNAIIYFVVLLFFVQFLYPKIMNRTMKEGTLSIVFLILFSLISLTTSLLISLKHIQNFISIENIVLSLLLFGSIILLIKHERSGLHTRRVIR